MKKIILTILIILIIVSFLLYFVYFAIKDYNYMSEQLELQAKYIVDRSDEIISDFVRKTLFNFLITLAVTVYGIFILCIFLKEDKNAIRAKIELKKTELLEKIKQNKKIKKEKQKQKLQQKLDKLNNKENE